MAATTCPHGLDPARCAICRVLQPTPVLAARPTPGRSGRRRTPSAAIVVVALLFGFLVVGWVVAAVFAVLHVLELLAIAAVAGWVGFRLGVHRGRSGAR
jgi:hypothetical protein